MRTQPRSENRFIRIVAGSALLFATALPGRAQLHGIESGSGRLYRIDLGTGAATQVGPALSLDLGGIAFNSYGTLFGISKSANNAVLHTLRTSATGASTVGSTGIAAFEGALTFDPATGQLYGRGGSPVAGPDLISIDPITGVATTVGSMGLGPSADISGMDFFTNGKLLAHDLQGALPNRLLSIDTRTGRASVIGPTGDTSPSAGEGGLAVDPATHVVYLSNGTELWRADARTGAATLIGAHNTASPISGLSFHRDPCLIGIEWSTQESVLWNVDPTSGVTSVPRPMGVKGLGCLAQAPSGKLYAIQHLSEAMFHEVSQASGAATLIGPMGILVIEGGLDFDPVSGVLYGVNGKEPGELGGLFTVDITTGAATIIGPILNSGGTGSENSALAFDAVGNLYVQMNGANPIEVWRIDPANANVLAKVPIPGLPFATGVGGMEFDDATGKLYLSVGNVSSRIAEVDPVLGTSTIIGFTKADGALEVVRSCTPQISKPPVTIATPFKQWAVVNWKGGP